ncbi:MAG: tetratricopeptide repeat protein, partial [Planctomycetota bacterium]
MINQCSKCHLEIPKDFPETSDRLCPSCYRKIEGECMSCGGSPVEIVEFHRVLGLLALGFSGRRTSVLCSPCTRRIVMRNLVFTGLLGWLGITPFIRSIVGQRANIRSLYRHPSLPPASKPIVTILAYIVPVILTVAGVSLLLFLRPAGTGESPLTPLSDEARTLKTEAERELRQGHAPEAETLLRKALSLAPESPILRLGLGLALDRQGKLEAAEKEYRLCLMPFEKSPFLEGRQSLGNLLLRRGRFEEALKVLSREIELNRSPVAEILTLHKYYQDALVASGRRSDAIEIYEGKLSEHPDEARYLYLLGRVEAPSDPGKAKTRFRKSMESAPKFFDPLYALARVEYENGELDEAFGLLKKSLLLRKDSRQVLFSLGEVERARGNTEEARG